MLNIATFNIFWFPRSDVSHIERSPDDERLIEQVIARLNADVILFQEIMDVGRLRQLLGRIPGHQYQVRQTSPASSASTERMHLALACDAATVEKIVSRTLGKLVPDQAYPGPRLPVVARLRHLASQREFTVVGVHLKSDFPSPLPDGAGVSDKRPQELDYLAKWLRGGYADAAKPLCKPPTNDVLLLGDFNLVRGHALLNRLASGPLAQWRWLPPVVKDSLTPAGKQVSDPHEQWSTFLDKEFIDHVLVSPTLVNQVAAGGATVYAFDLDPALETCHFRDRDHFQCIPGEGKSCEVAENLYRVSDHRPVRVSFETP